MNKILLVDDDIDVLTSTKKLLETKGYVVTSYTSSKEAILDAIANLYDLMIIDYVMPDIAGDSFVDICKSLNNDTKIIIYSGSEDIDDQYKMLDRDIFDFISKSIDPRLFLKRVERAMKNTDHINAITAHVVESKKHHVIADCINRTVTKDGEGVQFSTVEFLILSLFLSMKNKTLTREYIHNVVWESRGMELEDYRTIDLYVFKIRKKLDVNCILSIRGIGYVWTEEE